MMVLQQIRQREQRFQIFVSFLVLDVNLVFLRHLTFVVDDGLFCTI